MKVTDWYPPKIKPVWIGTYERMCGYKIIRSRWDGRRWLSVYGTNIRSALKLAWRGVQEGLLLKVKRFEDGEFEIVGFEEREHNGNEATVGELGQTKRSSHKAGKSGRGDLGAVILRGSGDFTFRCGTGFDDEERGHIWHNQSAYLGKQAKIKYLNVGIKTKPRHPVWLGLRSEID